MERSTTVPTRTCDAEKEEKRKQGQRTTAAAARMGTGRVPSVEALAMAGCQCVTGEYCSDNDDGVPPVHLCAFEAFLEEVVPVGMIMVSQREEEARLRRGGKQRSYEDDMKEKLKLWAKAVAMKTVGIRS